MTREKSRRRDGSLKVAIIVDPYGSVAMDQTGDEEAAQHRADMTLILAPSALTFDTKYVMPPDLDADLVVFDFGGMSLGNDLLGDNSRRVLQWAQDHPSSLVLIVSNFTYRHGLLPELRERGLFISGKDDGEDSQTTPIHNIREFAAYDEKAVTALRAWFGMKRLSAKALEKVLWRRK